ncbi:MAG: phosphatidylcholine/phosphatidylserine synthase [Phycisphaerales bacterium]
MTDTQENADGLPEQSRRRRRLPPMSVLPTLCTLGNLVCGFAAIPYASMPADFTGPWGWSGLTCAAILIFVGMLLDAVDGSIARLTNSSSELGGQLDSLADVVTFGVAPAYMMLRLVTIDVGLPIIGPEADDALAKVVWAVGVVYLCCAALRLARFNVETGSTVERSDSFRGLPSPGAAGAVTSLILLHQHVMAGRLGDDIPPIFARSAALGLPFVTLLAAFAMVSSIAYPHVANRYLSGSRSFAYIVRLVVVLALAMWFPQETLVLLFMSYLVAGPVVSLLSRRGQR